ncbi:MAG TPA: FG-GAP and VCBS repeat-containing protein [Bacteroidota bacterium]
MNKHLSIITVFLFVSLAGTAHAQYFLSTILEVNGTPGSGMLLGTGIIGLGDINNDGKPDFAVSTHGIGKTFIYFGGQGVLDGVPDITLRGGDNMVMGDLNGDGLKELIIHQGYYTNTPGGLDTILVYFGKPLSPLSIDTVAGLIITSENAADGFGYAMDIGDLNNDGFDDLVIGASYYSGEKGKVYVYLGKSQLTNIPDFVIVGEYHNTWF